MLSVSVAGHFADALIAQKWTVLSVRRMMTCLGLVCPGVFLLFFSAVNNLALAVMFVSHVSSLVHPLVQLVARLLIQTKTRITYLLYASAGFLNF